MYCDAVCACLSRHLRIVLSFFILLIVVVRLFFFFFYRHSAASFKKKGGEREKKKRRYLCRSTRPSLVSFAVSVLINTHKKEKERNAEKQRALSTNVTTLVLPTDSVCLELAKKKKQITFLCYCCCSVSLLVCPFSSSPHFSFDALLFPSLSFTYIYAYLSMHIHVNRKGK